jgi:xanthosine utilization system XapX-like protein
MQLLPCPRLPPPLILAILHVLGLELVEMVLPVIAQILSQEAVGSLVLFRVFSLLPNRLFQLHLLGVSLLSL